MIGYPRNLRRREASEYLRERYNIHRAPSTLAKLAVVGGGPSFRHAGRVPLYPIPELDRWAESIMSPLRSSTSDRGAPATAVEDGSLDSVKDRQAQARQLRPADRAPAGGGIAGPQHTTPKAVAQSRHSGGFG
jgi:hypothetical protein